MTTSSNPISLSIKRLFQKATNIHKKINQKQNPKPNNKKVYPLETIMESLTKPKGTRTKTDIKILSDYLSNKYDFFKKLRDAGETKKLERLVSVLNLEIFSPNEPIILFGEEGDKFYILLDGRVNLYKTVYHQKTLTIQEYLIILHKILNEEKNTLKYERILEKNNYLNLDMKFLMSIPPESFKDRTLMTLFIEDEEILNDFGDGFAFGEIALLKKTKRNATIKAQTNSKLVSIVKSDYNRIIKELEEKRLEKELTLFKGNYTIFKHWSLNHLIRLFNCFTSETILSGEYLYKQNEDSDYIFIITSGKFEIYSLVSMGWIEDFYNYIVYSKSNLVYFLGKNGTLDETELLNVIEKAKNMIIESPVKYDPLKVGNIITSINESENIFNLQKMNEDLRDQYNLFKINIRVLDGFDVLGVEDAVEMKKRFSFVKCVSSTAEVKKVKLVDFIRLINCNPEEESKQYLLDYIAEKKSAFYRQLKKGVFKQELKISEIMRNRLKYYDDNKRNEKTIGIPHLIEESNTMQKRTRNNSIMFELQLKQKESMNKNKVFDKCSTLSKIENYLKSTEENDNNIINNNKKINLKKIKFNHKLTITEPYQYNSSTPSLYVQSESFNKIIDINKINKKEKSDETLTRESLFFHKPKIKNSISTLNSKKSANNIRKSHLKIDDNQLHSQYLAFNQNCPKRNNNRESDWMYFNSTSKKDKGSFLSSPQYAKKIETSYEALTTEIFKLTGVNKIIPKKEILFHVVGDDDENAMIIESCNTRKKELLIEDNKNFNSLSSSCGTNTNSLNNKSSNRSKSYLDPSTMIKIQMKNFTTLRKKKNYYTFNIYE